MREIALTILGCAAMFAIVPLMVWGGTGSWRAALSALRQYLQIIGVLALLGGGLGLVMALSEHGLALFTLPLR